jgi:hypothetical protein
MRQHAESPKLDVTVMTLVAAIAAAFGAFAILQPKFAVGAAMKRQVGSVETAFRRIYIAPQFVGMGAIVVVCLILLAAFVHSLIPAATSSELLDQFASFFVLQNLVWIVLLASILGGVIYTNAISWFVLGVSAIASSRRGQSAGWHQALNVCSSWDKGHPLLISSSEVERLANEVLRRLTLKMVSENFAAKPSHASNASAANIALFGCILEAVHYSQRWTTPKWGQFYASLDAINRNTKLFEPAEILKFKSAKQFSDQFRSQAVAELGSRREPVPTDSYLAAAEPIGLAWKRLANRGGSVLELAPSWTRFVGGRTFWLDLRLSHFPMLGDKSMRPQLIKLLARWKALPWATPDVFAQPFARRLGWLLLQEGAVQVLSDQKDVTFKDIGDVALTQIACLRIYHRVAEMVATDFSSEATAVGKQYPTAWDLFAAADFVLWDWATQQERRGKGEHWDGTKGWKWKLEDGKASAIS